MKFAAFFLGVVTGPFGTYEILTRVWWPDIRIPADRNIMFTATATALPPPPAAEATPMPLAPSSPEAGADGLPASTTPQVPDPSPAPQIADAGSSPPRTPPFVMRIDLPILVTELDKLRARSLLIPVSGIGAKSLRDSFSDTHDGHLHAAIDIMAARGTPVVAVEDGHVEKLFTSKPGGLTVYQFDPQGEYCYYYAHLDSYATGLVQGAALRKGEVIGYVGSTGNASASAPHLHFSIVRLCAAKHWWEGTAVDPYPLWAAPPQTP